MFIPLQAPTAVVHTEPALELRGAGKFFSKSLLEEPNIDSYLAMQAGAVKYQHNPAESVIDAIGNLGRGWDGYGAVAISPIVCAHAKRFLLSRPSNLSSPEITPTSNGTMNFEWASNDADAYLEIGQTRYTGHIQTKNGQIIYLDGTLAEQNSQDSGGIQQVLALISGLLHATSTAPSIAQSF
jgi:hypothetical protein